MAEALVELLRPVRSERRRALAADPGAVPALLAAGADKARSRGLGHLPRAADAIGLLSPG